MINENYMLYQYVYPGVRPVSDNIVITDCDDDFLLGAEEILKSCDSIKSVVIKIDDNENSIINNIEINFDDDLKKKVLTRTCLTAKIMRELLLEFDVKNTRFHSLNDIEVGLNYFKSLDKENMIKFYRIAPMIDDIEDFVKKNDNQQVEINFILTAENINKNLQRAINDLIYSRLPFLVRVLTNQKELASYYTLNGEFIEVPHDYVEKSYLYIKSSEKKV